MGHAKQYVRYSFGVVQGESLTCNSFIDVSALESEMHGNSYAGRRIDSKGFQRADLKVPHEIQISGFL